MKQIKYILFSFLIIFLSIPSVNAQCTNEELNELKKEATKIRVTYKHLGSKVDEEGTIVDYMFDLTFSNLTNDMYVRLDNESEEWKEINNNKIVINNIATGKYKFSIYSNTCQNKIGDINVKIPRFNSYSLDPLCDGIDGEDFSLCAKYLDYQPTYETFVKKVEEYKKTHDIKKEDNNTKRDNISLEQILNSVLRFITKNQLYIIIGLSLLLILLIVLIIIKRIKKRGVLE